MYGTSSSTAELPAASGACPTTTHRRRCQSCCVVFMSPFLQAPRRPSTCSIWAQTQKRSAGKKQGPFSYSERAPYKQQAVESQSIICQIKNGPPSRAMAEASFDFQMAGRQIRRIVALTCENHNQICVASPLVSRCGTCYRALGGNKSPAGEKTEISLL
jgi:hypothetical protein